MAFFSILKKQRGHFKMEILTPRLRLISRWKIICKTIGLCEKVENKLSNVERCSFAFVLYSHGKKFLWVVVKKN